MCSEGYGTWSVCLFILELQATKLLMKDTDGFSATIARKIMWQILPKRPSSGARILHCDGTPPPDTGESIGCDSSSQPDTGEV